MADFDQLPDIFGDLANKVIEGAGKKVRATALAIDQNVVLATPVDTGRARANWLVDVDNERIEATEDTDKSGQAAIAAGRAAINSFNPERNARIYITNNLPYIGPLNAGSSAQAPANFVQAAVMRGQQQTKNIKILE